MILGCNALANLIHVSALQLRVDEVNAQHPTRIVECLETHSILMLPRIVAVRLIPLDNVAEIDFGVRTFVAFIHRMT